MEHATWRRGYPRCDSRRPIGLTGRGVARHAIYRQVEERMASEAYLVPSFYEQAYRFARPELTGISASFWIPTLAYEELRMRGD